MPEPQIVTSDLNDCDREPIHIPGAIQPHGVLLSLGADMEVRQSAGDLRRFLGYSGDPAGRHVRDVLELKGLHLDGAEDQASYVGTVLGPEVALDVFAHRSGDELVLELEPAPLLRRTGAEVLRDLLPIVSGVAGAPDMIAASNVAAAGVRRITGYDRIMIYRFLDDGSGEVIAEARAEDLSSFLNHRYPASDIPQQARALYLRNPIRLIPDVSYEPVPISGGERPLDLTGALLRSVSPVHLQYLKNMEVGASASVSLVSGGRLWGLIACHNRTAKLIAHEDREMCHRVAIALDQAIGRLEEENVQREALRLTRRREELLPVVAAAESLAIGLRGHLDELRRLVAADGVALVLDSEVVCSGVTPPDAAVDDLARWVLREAVGDQLATEQLSELYLPASQWPHLASGLLSCVVSRTPLIALLWFRPEQVQTVNWAGNPHKPVEVSDSSGRLNPRKSFEVWAETVRSRSRSWRPNEKEAARRTASALADVGVQKALVELNRQLTSQVAEKDLLMREMHHRVQNSLQLVTSLLDHREKELGGGEGDARRQLELARDRVMSVALLHRRLWRSDDLQEINLETFFQELVEGLSRTWSPEWHNKLSLDVAPIRIPAQNALLIALIISELLTNAVKHAYSGAAGPLRVTARDSGKDRLTITVADFGVGTAGEASPTSFGSRFVRQLVDKMGGDLRITPNDPGTSVTIVVPVGLER